MRRWSFILLLGWFFLPCAVRVCAQDSVVDSLLIDTILETPDPEWYVALISPEPLRAEDTAIMEEYCHPFPKHLEQQSRRSELSNNICFIDSVISIDYEGNILSQAYYEYDVDGHTIAEMVYDWNSGKRMGVFYSKKVYVGSIATSTINYQWDNFKGAWIAKDSTQLIHYANGLLNSSTKFVWENNQWRRDDSYRYEYFNDTDKMTKSIHIKWNAISQQEDSVDMYEWIYDNANSKILLSSYWVYTNGARIGKTKTVYTYDSEGKTILEEKYKGWENGDWKGSEKNTYVYNAYGKVIDNIIYKWSSGWQYLKRITQEYDSSKRLIDKANYVWNNNAWKGSSRTSTEYVSSVEKAVIVWQWDSSIMDWMRVQRTSTISQGSNIKQQTIQYWADDKWVNYSLLQNTYTAKNLTLSYTASWDGTEWKDSLRTIYDYNNTTLILQVTQKSNGQQWIAIDSMKRDLTYATIAGKNLLISDSTMVWSASSNKWVGQTKTVNAYDSNGNVLTEDTYTFMGNRWIPDQHTENGYKDNNAQLKLYTFTMLWNSISNKWEASGPKMEYEYDDNNIRVGSATYRWDGSKSKWIGVSRSYETYVGSLIDTKYVYQWNNVTESWIYSTRFEYEYSENLKVKETKSIYNSQQTSWIYSDREQYEYDVSGTIIGTMREIWREGWCTLSLEKEFYNAEGNGRRLRYTLSEEYSNCQLSSYVKETYFYSCDSHTIRFVNWDGTVLETQALDKGVIPVYAGEVPTKQSDEQYSYTFVNWTPEISSVTGDATYTAIYDRVINNYTITFLNNDSTVLKSGEVAYGAMPEYTEETPTKPATAQYTYAFKNWAPEIAAVSGEATYIAEFDSTLNSYAITFKNYDGSVLRSSDVEYGSMPQYTGGTPNKPSNAQYTYTFKGWTPEVVTVTAATTYTAEFDSTLNNYLITFVNYDGTELQSTEVAYGSMPSYPDETPTKPRSDQYTYTFKGWMPEVVTVTAATTYTAEFDSTLNKYLITFVNYDGTELQSTEVAYGSMPSYPDETPTKPRSDQYTYTFKGWMPEVVTVTAAATYTAEFDSVVNEYPIVFLDEDGTKLDSMSVAYGTTPTTTVTPFKPATAEYSYTFSGWTPEIAEVTGEATYTATYTNSVNSYTISFVNYDGSVLKNSEEEYGTMPQYTGRTPNKPSNAQYTYTFNGWSPAINSVTGEATYTAQFDSIIHTYTVIFYYEDGVSVVDSMTLAYGETPHTDLVPSIPGDAQYTYVFAGWSPNVEPATGDASYTATYDRILKQYTITFKNYNGQVLQSVMIDYGTVPEYTGATPVHQGNVQYTYTFTGWTPELVAVTGEATYTAVFEEVVNTYIVIFYDEDGITELDRQEVEYGQKPVYGGETPTKAEDEEYTYTFAGWSPKIIKVTGDATYRATYTATKKTNGLSPVTGNPSPVTVKILIDGTIYIRRGTHLYTLDGVLVD